MISLHFFTRPKDKGKHSISAHGMNVGSRLDLHPS